MRKIKQYMIQPSLPERLQSLAGLARNLWWTWNPDAFSLWSRMDSTLWESTYHNPVKLLGKISQSRLDQLAEDDGFTTHMDRVMYNLMNYMESAFWFQKNHKETMKNGRIAYFSAEYGLTESLPIYSGGLGVLSGDHLKSASDLGLPLVGVGLLYTQGYFKQYLNPDGWQQEFYPDNDFYNMPLFPETDDQGKEIKIEVPYPGRMVTAKVWRIQVGRTPLYLLDSNTGENRAEDRAITHQLYGGDNEMRIKQEIMLGIGGVIALRAVGVTPEVFHMNEGHSAFLTLERMKKMIVDDGLSFEVAKEKVIASSVFTTHTPVPAGNDIFSKQRMQEYLGDYAKSLKIDFNELLALGRDNEHDREGPFSMPVFALRLSAFTNGVSALHGDVSRKLWAHLYKGLDENDVPIRSVTNGVHIRSWLSEDMWNLFDRYLGQQWIHEPANDTVWRRISDIPDSELWRTHERRREQFVGFARGRLKDSLEKRGATAMEIRLADEALSPEALTIGFARRFATYKRGNLLFMNMDRLKSILCNKERPIQIVMAGKAHPRDEDGKKLIRNIIHWIRDDELRNHIVFLEDYDINVARNMVQGVDVWLNTPRRPMEASGTSGMKASANGALNMSILDGWWCEGYKVETGWAIGSGENYADEKEQDKIESRAVYDLLEKELAPLFYNRGKDDLPRGWIKMMKASLSNLNAVFNTNRMVRNYTQFFYIPCALRSNELTEDGGKRIKELAEWKRKVVAEWGHIYVGDITETGDEEEHLVGRMLEVKAMVHTGALKPEDLRVEIYYGSMDANGSLVDGKPAPMVLDKIDDGKAMFKGSVPLTESGRYGYSIRVLPNHPDLFGRIEPGLVCWSE